MLLVGRMHDWFKSNNENQNINFATQNDPLVDPGPSLNQTTMKTKT
jgi:hypothetical protein